MKELILNVEIIFMEIAKESFHFPVTNSIRLSFWLPEQEVSTFSEIQIKNNSIEVGKAKIVEIKLVERDFLFNKIKTGTEFKLGTFPNSIAVGKVIEVKSR